MSRAPDVESIPFLDLEAQNAPLHDEIEAACRTVVESQRFVLGPDVERFESEFATYCGTQFAVGCAFQLHTNPLGKSAVILRSCLVPTLLVTFRATHGQNHFVVHTPCVPTQHTCDNVALHFV